MPWRHHAFVANFVKSELDDPSSDILLFIIIGIIVFYVNLPETILTSTLFTENGVADEK